MCGICGVFNFRPRAPVDQIALKQAASALAHRGPDDEGFYIDREIGLGIRRLSIIDLARGHQPLSNEDGSIWIAFNGEIYNYRDLRSSLLLRGHVFRTATDTEVILHLYEERGTACLDDLRGMFAFALWDGRSRRLFLARDRLGVKPLFYRVTNSSIQFASELAALRPLAPQTFEIDRQSLYDFFAFRYVPAPQTLYRGVRKLLPGHFLVADESGAKEKCYWDIPASQEDSRPAQELAGEAVERLRESVRLRLVSDVPLGIFLSGGIDSSAIASLMAEEGVKPLRSFSVGFDEAAYSELPWARRVARLCSTEHQELLVRADDVERELPRLIGLRQEPVAEPTDVALYLLARLASRSVKVALAGEGGDELFGGYPKYAADWLAPAVSSLPRGLARRAASMFPYRLRRAQSAFESLSIKDEAERFVAWFASFSCHERSELLSRDFLSQMDEEHPARVFAQALGKDRQRSRLKRMLYADLKIWLPDNLLLRGDHMTMAASIEERVPMLDHKLVEWAAGIPDRLLIRPFRAKAFLRRALEKQLPREILERRKVGFAVPVGLWFRGPLQTMLRDLVLSPQALARGYFNPASVRRLVEEHLAGTRDRQKQLWTLLNFELWQRQLQT